jgi:CRISPR-associated protein Cmr6
MVSSWFERILDLIQVKNIDDLNLYSLATITSICSNFSNGESPAIKSQFIERFVLSRKARFDAAIKIINEVKSALKGMSFEVIDITAKTTSRTSPGLSSLFGKPLFDIGLSFHPILNLPYIPGSMVKGATKSAFQKLVHKKEDEDQYFGNKSSGELFFADAYPIASEKSILWPDIVNPHYFSKGKTVFREDEVNPVPIPHLTIPIGTTFQFLIGCGPDTEYKDILSSFFLACKMGLGARRNVGYGIFDVVEVR